MADVTIYPRIGGEDAVAAAVDLFYERVPADPQSAGYFTGVDLAVLKRHQRAFVGRALGSGRPYTGRAMRRTHSGIDVSSEDFDRVLGHLVAALELTGADAATVGSIAGAAPLEPDVVARPWAAAAVGRGSFRRPVPARP
ncbi:Group 1 truncated hemoglobin GlbN [Streptomyces sp. YIM 130001]|uniref:group I truncated hemoglobin n=1 Tax=Streptomyces sp. YIM 130001 TaxID=2259644 RepID=UPI000ED90D02|nr:group 1 truncated hemoglobin [Streptomyces sp. YIM 130001]RII18542.1 Group 1 truncated hemoglobin GlbN [Streptomyces sp. YIM 130001]